LQLQSGDERVHALMMAAGQCARRGQTQEAERLLRQAQSEAPNHPLVQNEIAARLLHAGNGEKAATLLQDAVERDPANPELWFNLACALRMINQLDEAIAALDRALELEPRMVRAQLEKGMILEQQDQPRAAAMSFRSALQMVPPSAKPPPELERLLRQARRAVDASNRALESYIEDGLEDIKMRFPESSFRRFEQCVDIILQKRTVSRQQPTFMYFPELPAIEFYDRQMFPWLDSIEAAADDIRGELLDVLSDGEAALEPYVVLPKGVAMEQWRELNRSRRWSVYSLWNEGTPFPNHIRRCPKTVKALRVWPRWDVPANGPTALFSVLNAKTRIPPHTGPVNTRLVVHLPLIVPPGCGFRVGGQQREWQPGKAFVFDDSINHEAWNDSDLPRAVMIFDTWSPFLNEAERELVRALTTYVGQYYGTKSNNHIAGSERLASAAENA
jgi:aspartyl/asparaginyl beta-hydroxylase (cupin superfamily)/cytochrome c-type biogenesis protein CcmH/NrfG